jgi:hypothetical protein
MIQELTQLDESTLERLRTIAKEDFFIFCKGVLNFRDMSPVFHGPLCDLLMNDDIPDKLCVLPRGTFKTSICTIAFPLWTAVRNANVTILIVQNTHTNALAKLGRYARSSRRMHSFGYCFLRYYPREKAHGRMTRCALTARNPKPRARSSVRVSGQRSLDGTMILSLKMIRFLQILANSVKRM